MSQQLILLVAFPHEVLQLRIFGAHPLQHAALFFVICVAIGQGRHLTFIAAHSLPNPEPRLEAINAARKRTGVLYKDLE